VTRTWQRLADSGVPRHIRCFCAHYYWDPRVLHKLDLDSRARAIAWARDHALALTSR